MATRRKAKEPAPTWYVPVVNDWVRIDLQGVRQFGVVTAVLRTSSPATHRVTVRAVDRVEGDREVLSLFPRTYKWKRGSGFINKSWTTETATRSSRAEMVAFQARAGFWVEFRKKVDALLTIADHAGSTWPTTSVSDERDAELFIQAKTAVATLTALLHEEKARRMVDGLVTDRTPADPAANPDGKRRTGGVVCDTTKGPCACKAWH